MKRIIILTLAVLGLALQMASAQKNAKSDDSGSYKYHKALEILREDGDPDEARKLFADNVKENPKHVDSYMLLAAIDRNEEDYASALHQLL